MGVPPVANRITGKLAGVTARPNVDIGFVALHVIKRMKHGDAFGYRIVESVRVGTQVKQRTILNLGKDFAIDPAHWPLLTARIEQFLQGSVPRQAELFDLADELGQLLEAAAKRSL
jgi:hypothetical protein